MNSNEIEYTKNITLTTKVIPDCPCSYTVTSVWTIQEIDSSTGVLISDVSISNNPSITTSLQLSTDQQSYMAKLNLLNGTLKYGLYKFTYAFTIKTNDLVNNTLSSSIFTFVKVIPSGFIVSAFDTQNGFIKINTSISLGLSDSVAFIPAFYSYDLDNLLDPNSLIYNFYCILAAKNTNPNNFNQDLYSVKVGEELSQTKISSLDTCFKTTGKFLNETIFIF